MPDFGWDSVSGELRFVTSPGTFDRCLRILLPGVADFPGSRGRFNCHRRRRRTADGYQAPRDAGSPAVRQPDSNIQYIRMVLFLRELRHESDSQRNA